MTGTRARQKKTVADTEDHSAPSHPEEKETSVNVIKTENLRPGAGGHLDNLLAASLLPLTLLTSLLTSADPVSSVYRNLCSSSLGLILVTSHTYIRDVWRRDDTIQGNLSLTHLLLAALSLAFLPPNTQHNYYVTFWTIITFRPILALTLRKFPLSFSFGEASILCQGALYCGGAIIMKILTIKKWSTRDFALELARNLNWVEESLMLNRSMALLLVFTWSLLVLSSVAVVALYTSRGWVVTTGTRKLFHVAIVLVFTSGLQHCHLLLLVSSYAALALMLGLEWLRVTELVPAVSSFLTQRLRPFLDSKDSGRLILTNIYLLVGLSLPLWTDPGPVSMFASSSLNLYSGLISVGVADTAAAVIGTLILSLALYLYLIVRIRGGQSPMVSS